MLASITALFLASPLAAYTGSELSNFYEGSRGLWLQRDGEYVKTIYYKDGKYIRSAYEEICYLLRDVNQNKIVEIDPALLDVMSYTQKWFIWNSIESPIIISSGFRTFETNMALENAARLSKHLEGKAIDGHIVGVSKEYFGDVARRVGGGGIGIYPTHTHIDTGPIRNWRM